MYIQLLVNCTEIAADRLAPISVQCTKSCFIKSKSAPEDGRVCSPKHVDLILKYQ